MSDFMQHQVTGKSIVGPGSVTPLIGTAIRARLTSERMRKSSEQVRAGNRICERAYSMQRPDPMPDTLRGTIESGSILTGYCGLDCPLLVT